MLKCSYLKLGFEVRLTGGDEPQPVYFTIAPRGTANGSFTPHRGGSAKVGYMPRAVPMVRSSHLSWQRSPEFPV
jgi:hypothetical protein